MICSNLECKKEIIGRRSDARSCSIECSLRVKYLREEIDYKEQKKIYWKQYSLKNKLKLRLKNKEYRNNNKEKIYLRVIVQRIRDSKQYKKKAKEYKLRYRIDNREKYLLENKIQSSKYRAKKLQAIPKFANLDKIKEIYKNCPKGFHVDHIIPLNNPIVCGLHVEWNLQYLTPSNNLSKSNKLIYLIDNDLIPATAR